MKIYRLYALMMVAALPILPACHNEALEKESVQSDKGIKTRTSALPADYYYWYNGEKIEISSIRNLYYVSSTDSLALLPGRLKARNIMASTLKSGNTMDGKQKKLYWKIVSVDNSSAMSVSTLANEHVCVAPVFGESEADYVPTSEFFYVKLKSDKDKALLKDVANKFSCEVVEPFKFMENWFVLKAPVTSNGLLMSNAFYETGHFANVDPAFMFDFSPTSCPNEPDFGKQWGMDRMKLCEAWDITKGKSDVVVAVLDQGVDQNHKEFANNYSPLSYDIINGSSPSVVRGSHGTHVGGIIGANHNNIQVAGVAPQAIILSISHSLYITANVSKEMADGIKYAKEHGAAVINNSWGDHNGLYQELHSSCLDESIKDAIRTGRNSKGMVVVFAAGNGYGSDVDYPANVSPDILVVGSTDNSDRRSDFSSYGAAVDVVAPGSDILSTFPNNTTGYLSGTSMAAPHVAGLAALILSINPELTQKEVVDIIEKTAQKVGGYTYSNVAGRKNGTWNNEMGYGLCNAFCRFNNGRR